MSRTIRRPQNTYRASMNKGSCQYFPAMYPMHRPTRCITPTIAQYPRPVRSPYLRDSFMSNFCCFTMQNYSNPRTPQTTSPCICSYKSLIINGGQKYFLASPCIRANYSKYRRYSALYGESLPEITDFRRDLWT